MMSEKAPRAISHALALPRLIHSSGSNTGPGSWWPRAPVLRYGLDYPSVGAGPFDNNQDTDALGVRG